MAGCVGAYVCTIAAPGNARPLRPATCVIRSKVRSVARKSGAWSPASAAMTHASVTVGKSRPLRDHLRADEHVSTFGELIEQARVIADARRRIAVHTHDAGLRKEHRNLIRDGLGSDAELF